MMEQQRKMYHFGIVHATADGAEVRWFIDLIKYVLTDENLKFSLMGEGGDNMEQKKLKLAMDTIKKSHVVVFYMTPNFCDNKFAVTHTEHGVIQAFLDSSDKHGTIVINVCGKKEDFYAIMNTKIATQALVEQYTPTDFTTIRDHFLPEDYQGGESETDDLIDEIPGKGVDKRIRKSLERFRKKIKAILKKAMNNSDNGSETGGEPEPFPISEVGDASRSRLAVGGDIPNGPVLGISQRTMSPGQTTPFTTAASNLPPATSPDLRRGVLRQEDAANSLGFAVNNLSLNDDTRPDRSRERSLPTMGGDVGGVGCFSVHPPHLTPEGVYDGSSLSGQHKTCHGQGAAATAGISSPDPIRVNSDRSTESLGMDSDPRPSFTDPNHLPSSSAPALIPVSGVNPVHAAPATVRLHADRHTESLRINSNGTPSFTDPYHSSAPTAAPSLAPPNLNPVDTNSLQLNIDLPSYGDDNSSLSLSLPSNSGHAAIFPGVSGPVPSAMRAADLVNPESSSLHPNNSLSNPSFAGDEGQPTSDRDDRGNDIDAATSLHLNANPSIAEDASPSVDHLQSVHVASLHAD